MRLLVNDDDRIARTRAFFAERFPEVLKRAAKGGALASSLVYDNGVAVDVTFDGRRLYGGDARQFVTDQVAAFMRKPLRLYMADVANSGLVSRICIRMVGALHARLQAEGLDAMALHPRGNPTFLVVFGLGLGHHLMELARRTEARWLILVEPLVGLFEPSFEVVDWPALVEAFEARGGAVHLVTDGDPVQMVTAIARRMAEHGIPYVDGTWVYTHYPHWAFREARTRLHEAVEFAFINRGFFEDELRMMTNAVENFARCDFRLLEGKPRLRRPETAVLAGAGPSLDEGLETIHRIRDRVVLFSCGTALRPLLKNGLVPDFHCELENVPAVYDVLSDTAQFGDLGRITLIATSTVDPRVPPLFGETVLFWRELVSPTEIMSRGAYRPLPAASPTCVNLGMAAAAYLGFAEFVLFGTDCGVRPGGNVHAEGTVYRDIGLYRDIERERANPIEVEGNFGGVVRTNWIYDACRLMLSGAIAHYRFSVVNCSDGAVIPGARPCAPEALTLAAPPVDRAAFAAAVREPMRRFAPGEMLRAADLPAARAAAQRLLAELDELLAGFADAEPDFAGVFEAVKSFVAAIGDRFARTESIIVGTLNALPRIGMFYGFRIEDAAVRRRLFACYITEFRAIIAEMATRIETLFAGLEEFTPAPVAASVRSEIRCHKSTHG